MIMLSRFTRYFMEVARIGSVRGAAETLHVSASAIDRQIINAEREIGVALFERLSSGMRLTAAGEVLFSSAKEAEKSFRRAIEQVEDLQQLRRGHIDIAMIDALGEGFIAQVVADFAQTYPKFTFGLQTAKNQDVINQVLQAEVDLGLVLDPPPHRDLKLVKTLDVPIGIAVPLGHTLCESVTVELAEALPYRLLLPGEPLIIHDHIEKIYALQNVDKRRLTTCSDIRTMRSLVRQGAGVGLLSWLDVMADVNEGRLHFIPLRTRQLRPFQLALCVAANRQISKSAKVALNAIEDAMSVAAFSPVSVSI